VATLSPARQHPAGKQRFGDGFGLAAMKSALD